jgi:tetratricopeptide (TPR) repeat protein
LRSLARPAALLVALGALVVLPAACSSPDGKLETANALRHQGKQREALLAYREILGELGDGTIPRWETGVRLKALQYAADVSYLELGDYLGAIGYYRRIVSLHPGTDDAWRARAAIGDIYAQRLGDRRAAITQYAAVAQGDSKDAPRFQLLVARQYLELKNFEQARTEARILREKWPQGAEADDAQLLTAQAWSLEDRPEEALGAFQAAVDRRPRPEIAALALEGEAQIQARAGRFDKAIELYTQAMPGHPNPDVLRTNIDKVRERREAAKTVTPGDRDAALDRNVRGRTKEIP